MNNNAAVKHPLHSSSWGWKLVVLLVIRTSNIPSDIALAS